MPSIQKSKIVPYTQQQMYALVNDVSQYAQFVPWCVSSEVLHASEFEVRASLGFAAHGIRQSFTTVNRLQPHKMIEIRLLQGPFRHLEGFWQFEATAQQQSRVSLDMEFEFSSKLLGMMFGPLFNQIASGLVEAFSQRAREVYR